MKIKQKQTIFLFTLLFFAGQDLSADTAVHRERVEQGLDLLQLGRHEEAVGVFNDLLNDPAVRQLREPIYFYLAQCLFQTGRYQDALFNVDFYLNNYPKDAEDYIQVFYLKGRLLIETRQFEAAAAQFGNFINQFPESALLSNAYFWIGESLYHLGHFEQAEDFFYKIVDQYPESYKIEAAKYKLALIEISYRQQVLVNLIKLSHEKYLKTLEDFRRRERVYEQSLAVLQKSASSSSDQEESGSTTASKATREQRLAALEDFLKRSLALKAGVLNMIADQVLGEDK